MAKPISLVFALVLAAQLFGAFGRKAARASGSTKCLCIVSYEDALVNREAVPKPAARDAVNACVDPKLFVNGLGVATTNNSDALIKDSLRKLDSKVFDEEWLSSPALQTDIFGVKTLAYRRIIDYLNATSTCTMVFDTVARRLADAKAAGAGIFKALDKHKGFDLDELHDAETYLDDSCMCKVQPSSNDSSDSDSDSGSDSDDDSEPSDSEIKGQGGEALLTPTGAWFGRLFRRAFLGGRAPPS